ncbi:uncharacterized protein LOC124286270 isoform X4 [Haliotis rubra]|uniref:uncharacterized protein LOC124286270 isoform X4 n=1 Tax=Haliotis rubra TaxID=36100 RepID=UPI001EE58F95|nr:uncharacterized protein LOC124286270 isoform X4 [Haliotis rubra]
MEHSAEEEDGMAEARPPPIEKTFKMANKIEVVTYVGDITMLSSETGVTGVVTGEGQEFQHESYVTKALKEYSNEFAEKREELKMRARYFKSWSVHTTKLSASSPFSYVFHAVIKNPDHTNRWVKKTGKLYKKIMKKAEKYDVKVLAIPLLGTGRGGAKKEDAAQAAVGAVAKFENPYLEKVFLVTKDTSVAEVIDSQCEYERSPLSREKTLKRRKSFMKRLGCAGSRTDDGDSGSYRKAPVDNRSRRHQNADQYQSVYKEKYTPISDSRRDETNIQRNQYTRSMDTSENRHRHWPDNEDDNSYRNAPTNERSGSGRNHRRPAERYTHNANGHGDGERAEATAAVQKEDNSVDTREAVQRPVAGPSDDDGRREGSLQAKVAGEMYRDHERSEGRKEVRGGNSDYKNMKDKTTYSSPGRQNNGDTVGESRHRTSDVAEVHSSYMPSQTVPSESRSDPVTSLAMVQRNNSTTHRNTTHDSHQFSSEGNRKDRQGDDGRRQQPRQQTKTTTVTGVAGQTRSDERESHSRRVNHGSAYPVINLDAVGGRPGEVNYASRTCRERGMDNSTRQEMAIKTEINGTCNGDNDGTITQLVNGSPGNNKNESNHDVKFLDMSVTRNCPICICPISDPKWLDKCGHVFCRECIDNSFKKFKTVCPSCNMVYGVLTGNQPEGTMDVAFSGEHLPGYETCGTISITYDLPSGIQGADHPNPGQPYKGTKRRAFLPDCREGRDVLRLLRKAFDRKLTFTVGRSSTTGQENVVTWNDIHHKTKMDGGPTRFGYPDPDYLGRVKCELASKGVTDSKETTF